MSSELIKDCRSISILLSFAFANLRDEPYQELRDGSIRMIVYLIFFYLRIILVTNVLYRLLAAYNARRHMNRRFALLSRLHRCFLVILFIPPVMDTIVSAVAWEGGPIGAFSVVIDYLPWAADSLFLLASIEIMLRAYMIGRKRKNLGFPFKVGMPWVAGYTVQILITTRKGPCHSSSGPCSFFFPISLLLLPILSPTLSGNFCRITRHNG